MQPVVSRETFVRLLLLLVWCVRCYAGPKKCIIHAYLYIFSVFSPCFRLWSWASGTRTRPGRLRPYARG